MDRERHRFRRLVCTWLKGNMILQSPRHSASVNLTRRRLLQLATAIPLLGETTGPHRTFLFIDWQHVNKGDLEATLDPSRITEEGRIFLQEQFAALKLPFVPSAANFVLVQVGDGAAIFKELLQRRIIVRALKGYHLPEWVRISIGTMDQNRACIAALKEVLEKQ